MCTISMNGSLNITTKHLKYKLNEQQYIETGRLARCQAVEIGRPVRCRNPLWEERPRGKTTSDYWAMTRHTPIKLSIHERDTPYILKGKYRENGNSGTVWVYNFIVVVISSIYLLISSIFISLLNSRSKLLSFSSTRVLIDS